MTGSTILDRTAESTEEKWSSVGTDREEAAHARQISDSYQRLIHGGQEGSLAAADCDYAAESTRGYASANSYAATTEAPAYTEYPKAPEKPAIPSAADRLADYVPITVGMTKIQRMGDMPSYSSSNVTNYATVLERPSETEEERPVSARPMLFEGLTFKNGELYDTNTAAPYAPVYTPVETPVEEPVRTPEYDPSYTPEEDAVPSRRTMESIANSEQEREGVGFFASLSAKAKVVLAVVATAILVMIAIACINTAVLSSLNAEIEFREAQVTQLSENAADLAGRLDDITDPENIAAWAQEQGMTK